MATGKRLLREEQQMLVGDQTKEYPLSINV